MKKYLIIALAASQLMLAGNAAAVQMFDFDAQAALPVVPGGAASIHGIVVNGEAVPAPLPLDVANFQYTLVVTGLVLDSSGPTSQFSGGTVVIYEDASTPAVWGAAGSFSDGVAILSGTLAAFGHTMFTATLGAGSGTVDWTGGTMLSSLAPADQLGWPFLTGISRAASQVVPGYTERWDGKLEPTEEVVGTESRSWGQVKLLFE